MKNRRAWIALIVSVVMLLTVGCASRTADQSSAVSSSAGGTYDTSYAEPAMEAASSESFVSADSDQASAPQSETDPDSDFDVRKIVYNANMTITADDPEQTLNELIAKTESLGGYLSGSYTTTDDLGATVSTATLKVPADQLETLVTAAKAAGKVDEYQLNSDDISLSYYDMQARLENAESEEQQLLEILAQCETVEEILAVRESLSSVRSDIESYTAQMNLWDNLVSYATLYVTINRTPKTAVEGEKELIQIWKASDVWNKMARGFSNSARFVVNALGAIGIFLAIAAVPAGVLFLAIGLPIILHKKKKRSLAAEKAKQAEDSAEPDETTKQNK
ncbi:MAG: DUF4349 domain-containing protein [Clostridiaceae bacterium]